ncbi:hypothetical protein HF521_015972 [Silurus meridionalis]|uniref:Uncharacterized protein n=1 Tax=Silurus meridionalis TaxID=175797 RepID=A0A8T0BPA0_SILME|nr:hypothetical protein HF521_015972 [Silurus meridionalis]
MKYFFIRSPGSSGVSENVAVRLAGLGDTEDMQDEKSGGAEENNHNTSFHNVYLFYGEQFTSADTETLRHGDSETQRP